MDNNSHIKYIYKLWRKIEPIQKREILILIILNIILSIIEIINVATIMPIISVVIKGENILIENEIIKNLINEYNIAKNLFTVNNLIYLFIFMNSLMFILKFIVIKMQNSTAYAVGKKINNKIYSELLNLNYLNYKSLNSSEHISLITTKSQSIIVNTIQPLINMIGLSIISLFLIYVILKINFAFGMIIILTAITSYGIIIFVTKNIIYKNSLIIDKKNTELVKIINESIGSIKDLIINDHKNHFIEKYKLINNGLKKSQSEVNLIGNLPRPFVEYILILIIIFYLMWTFEYGGSEIEELTGIIAVLYSVQRLIPLIQQLFYNYNSVKSSKTSLINIIESIETKKIYNNLNFGLSYNNSIKFENVSFKYPGTENWVLKNLNCEIFKGESIGLFGKSGVGKTTFIDLLMGLISPTTGKILIDDIELTLNNINSWHSKITHVPQRIYLTDESIVNNILFGCDNSKVDNNKLERSIHITDLVLEIKEFEESKCSNIGERSAKISGGQAQRIAIARALYKNSEIIILDESTNALDKNSEYKILKAIKNEYLNKNFIIITHREDLLKFCDKIIIFEKNNINVILSEK
jgi:ABC-type multidrug transport system fused ATPase/permease subunit